MDIKILSRIYWLLAQVSPLVGVSHVEIKNEILESLNLTSFKDLNLKNSNIIIQFLIQTKNDYNTDTTNTNESKKSST